MAKLTRAELLTAVSALPDALAIDPLYYVDSSTTDDHPEHHHCWCRKHADMVARIEALCTGHEMFIAAAWAGDDSAERCDWYGCNAPLNGGGLTDYGIDCALALTEADPMSSNVYGAELELAARSMSHDDLRWATWEAHARRMVRRRRKAA